MAKKKNGREGRKTTGRKKAATGRKKPASRTSARKSPRKKKSAKKKSGAAGRRGPRRAAKPATRSRRSSAAKARKSGKKASARSSRAASARKPRRSGARKTARTRRGDRGAAFFDHFRERLIAEREQIARRLDELREELRGIETTPRELEEWAQEEKDRDILIRLEERETEELRRIQAALGLIGTKEYGMCQVCGKPIPRARLEELPTAFRCIEHTP